MQIHLGSFLTSSLLAVFRDHLPSHLLDEDQTVPGTTEGVLTMGIVIVLIIVIPIVWTRRRWLR